MQSIRSQQNAEHSQRWITTHDPETVQEKQCVMVASATSDGTTAVKKAFDLVGTACARVTSANLLLENHRHCRFAIVVLEKGQIQSAIQQVSSLVKGMIPVLAIAASKTDGSREQALDAGATECLNLPIRQRDLEDAIHTMDYQSQILSHKDSMANHSRMLKSLSPRERRVVQLAADGYPNKQIATAVGLSVKSIERIRREAYQKLNVRSTAEMTRVFLMGSLHPFIRLNESAKSPVPVPHTHFGSPIMGLGSGASV